jgi:hypothetical protein
MDSYEAPVVRDYGDLLELTGASTFVGGEDGTGKVLDFDDLPPAVGSLP